VAFLYNQVSSQIDLFPLQHLVGVSDRLFLAIYDKIFQALGGQKALNRITRKGIQSAINFFKAQEWANEYLRLYGQGHVFLKISICGIDCESGLVRASVTFPLYGEAGRQTKVIRRLKNEIGLPGGITSDFGDIMFVVALRGEEMPHKAPPFDQYQRVGADGSFHVTQGELSHYTRCANPNCLSLALWLDKIKGIWCCSVCGATNSSLPGD